ncbi:hypothetical protein M422DRAFT_27805 [Sphaerobolus stellatus SS14]|nr:hypothetical protein M422DRAFT_27805 [Sphaerobolus stellatus SS14]
MSTVASRKKSIVGANGITSIDIPQQNNTLLNKSASQSTSLYQQCSQLRARLSCIRGFKPFLDMIISQQEPRKSTDTVHDLWDRLQLGIPLIYLFNLLPPPAAAIPNCDTNPASIDPSMDKKTKQRNVAQFSMAVTRLQQAGHWKGDLNFTVSDLMDDNTNGFVKVVQTLTFLVDNLPPEVFTEQIPPTPSPPSNASQTSFTTTASSDGESPREVERRNIIRELVETERKYVQDLEVMQSYSNALLQNHIIDQDTIHHLFPGLLKLLDFQRRFLISMEQTAEHSWKEQAWGKLFTSNEEDFQVYEPYCANYTNATELLLAEEQNLMSLADVINPKSELPAFLIKPVQRICKYPLLLQSLLKKCSRDDYPLYDDLMEGRDAAKRVTDKINEAQRRAENIQTVQLLQNRVEDWKGHHLANFGDLYLDDIFLVTKSEVDREYHVFLFEKIILCCKEAVVLPNKKVSKNNSLLKKQSIPSTPVTGGSGLNKKKSTPLLLKGRIFLNNVTSARKVPVPGEPHALRVFWRGEDDAEYFTLRCRSEEQLRQWEAAINRLIVQTASRRASERPDRQYPSVPNSTNPAYPLRHSAAASSYAHERQLSNSVQPAYPGTGTNTRFNTSYRQDHPYQNGNDPRLSHSQQTYSSNVTSIYPNSVAGLVRHPYGEDRLDIADQDFDDGPSPNSTGRGAPYASRRSAPDASGYANGAVNGQWRYTSQGVPLPPHPPSSNLPAPPLGALPARPPMGGSRNDSEASFSSGIPQRPALRSKFSTNRLRDGYDDDQSSSSFSRNGSQASLIGANGTRARSSSTPSQYAGPKPIPPPLPTHPSNIRTTGYSARDRGSGSSQSTGDSSDYSPPQTGSPITSFGSVDTTASIKSSGLRSTRSQVFAGAPKKDGPKVFIKVRYGEDLFTLDLPKSIDYEELVASVGHKVRRCGPRQTPGPLRIKYQDEDGDLVSLTTTEDVQIAFDMSGSAALTLYVS